MDSPGKTALWVLAFGGLMIALGVVPPGRATNPPSYYQQPPVLVPAYQTGYSAVEDLLKELILEVRGLRQDVRGERAAQGQDVKAVITNRCAACHQDGVAEDKGGSFVLVEKDGSPSELSVVEQRRVVREVEKGRMPPPPAKLSEAERKLILNLKP